MEINTFQIGDRVQLREDTFHKIDQNADLFPGLTGTVVAFYKTLEVGVQWDLDSPSRICHSLDGSCDDGYGWWVPPEALLLDDTPEVTVDPSALLTLLSKGG